MWSKMFWKWYLLEIRTREKESWSWKKLMDRKNERRERNELCSAKENTFKLKCIRSLNGKKLCFGCSKLFRSHFTFCILTSLRGFGFSFFFVSFHFVVNNITLSEKLIECWWCKPRFLTKNLFKCEFSVCGDKSMACRIVFNPDLSVLDVRNFPMFSKIMH